MNEQTEVPTSIEAFVKRSWPLLAGGAVLILLVSGLLFSLAVSGKVRKASSAPPSEATTTASVLAMRNLDGMPVSPEDAARQPYAVMVENAPDAHPLAGPAEANLVVEAPVEGGFTRLMLVFDATSTASQIGPVRSARPYFVEFADALKAVYAHVGGSPESLDKIRATAGFRDLDEFSNGKSFWRSAKRSAPHNVFTGMDDLRSADGAKGWSVGSVRPWRYLTPADAVPPVADAAEISIPYGGAFSVTWTYDRETNGYARRQNGAVQRDADGTAVTSTNVVILLTEEQVLDDVGRLKIRTTGGGKAWLFRDGKRFDVTWRRAVGEWFTFTVDGSDALFRPGKTWMSVVTSPNMAPQPKAE